MLFESKVFLSRKNITKVEVSLIQIDDENHLNFKLFYKNGKTETLNCGSSPLPLDHCSSQIKRRREIFKIKQET